MLSGYARARPIAVLEQLPSSFLNFASREINPIRSFCSSVSSQSARDSYRTLKERIKFANRRFATVSQVVSVSRVRRARKRPLGGVDDQQFKQEFDLFAAAIWSFNPVPINIASRRCIRLYRDMSNRIWKYEAVTYNIFTARLNRFEIDCHTVTVMRATLRGIGRFSRGLTWLKLKSLTRQMITVRFYMERKRNVYKGVCLHTHAYIHAVLMAFTLECYLEGFTFYK